MDAMPTEDSEEIQRLTQSVAQGDEASASRLMQLVYAQLRAAAVERNASGIPHKLTGPPALRARL